MYCKDVVVYVIVTDLQAFSELWSSQQVSTFRVGHRRVQKIIIKGQLRLWESLVLNLFL